MLEAQVGGRKRLVELTGKSEAQISQWATGAKDSLTGKRRGMSADIKRLLEKKCEKPYGWMDQPATNPDRVSIPQYDARGSMGDGLLLRDQSGVIRNLNVSKEWLTKNVKRCSAVENLCVVTGFGDSMRPMFNSGDPLLLDSGVKDLEGDAVYFFRVGDEGFIKRLQRIPGDGIRAISENKGYESWTIRPDMDFEIFGRIIKVWCSEDF